MYKKILVCLDNSDWSIGACDAAIALASAFGTAVTGCHVYAARLHDARFRSMEAGVPRRYQGEAELKRQREVHDSLITKGLQVISDSYLAVFQAKAASSGLSNDASGVSREGVNYEEILKEISEGGYGLAVMGAYGLGRTEPGRIGGVCGRVARRSPIDTLVIKDPGSTLRPGSVIVAAIDGSPEAFAGLGAASRVAKAFDCVVHAVAAYDHLYHVRAFRSLAGVLSEEAGRLFRFKEQERLHEEVIDKGLARVYADHLETASDIGRAAGVNVHTALLAGKPVDEIINYAARNSASLLVMGRKGIHAGEDIQARASDIGATAENCLREAACNVLLVAGRYSQAARQTPTDGPQWSDEALTMLERIPSFAQGVAKKMLEDRARETGIREITPAFMRKARNSFGGAEHDG